MAAKRLYQTVATQIAALIEEGAYPPGSRLPGERELAERLGVSRVTIREAEIALQATGRLEIKTGSGVYVSESPGGSHGELPVASAFEVTEARLLIESEAAALAAHNITDAEIEQLEELIEVMSVSDGKASNDADEKFHMLVAKASKNQALVHTVQSLWRMREKIPQVKATYEAVCVHDAKQRSDEHIAVVNALKARDAAGTRAAMREHFSRLIENMLDTTEQQALREVQQRASQSRERFLATGRLG
ncbi:GntR family transcriptional regulator [Aurantiacibacter atlanticus]|uniref:GntR family transcriptional regulator n=1 Tax=Aurantiacibacter atlanticus TaxID=1648404 RepID=A0A0H4VE26_9SPHN|nr:FadR/GntR family transcriptional regulator [Aurantiacibacter atlanticus]AKQ41349.1 GntR family transcriptional regulator [Aurantiacibacter atlanticus]MDF1835909.1 FadR/GntR family transcriptional regulator [Alteraurantiacibacter sp. bin_em_oilr2.035]